MEVAFVVEGEALVRIARNIAWMDRDRNHARRILACIDGLPKEAYAKILDGDATLTGDSSTGVRYVEEADAEWKKKVADRKRWLKSKQRKAWLREERDAPTVFIKDEDGNSRWRVPKLLLDQYVLVITRIKAGAFLGVSGAFAGDPLAFLALEDRRVEIHDQIMACLGLDRESEDGQAFTARLHAQYGLMGGGIDA